jgi:cobalt-precorrin-5B (C1)-methyltransferase
VKKLKSGITTGTCATAAATAAAELFFNGDVIDIVNVELPDGGVVVVNILSVKMTDDGAVASVIKYSGDDPDITDGCEVMVFLKDIEGDEITFKAGEGVGIVTMSGLHLGVGEPAINPVPREMMSNAVREYTEYGVEVIVSIKGGEELAKKTFNPRLGVVGGLSILGTSGRVVPRSKEAMQKAIECGLDVALENGADVPMLVPGNIGAKAAMKIFNVDQYLVVDVGNEWGYMLEVVSNRGYRNVKIIGHPGKIAKLAIDQWDTHSSCSDSAVPYVESVMDKFKVLCQKNFSTVEGIIQKLGGEDKKTVFDYVSKMVSFAIRDKFNIKASVYLIDMKGILVGEYDG